MTIFDPNLLQLVALGTKNDHYLPDGRHLRWFFEPNLGFPRSGFVLSRRPSPIPWNPKQKDLIIRRTPLSEQYIEDGRLVVTTFGLSVHPPRGGNLQTSGGVVAVNGPKLTMRFWNETNGGLGSPVPAAYVLLRYQYKEGGSIAATALYNDGAESQVQDRGAAGVNIPDWLEDLGIGGIEDDLRRVDGMPILPTSVDAVLADAQLLRRINLSEESEDDGSSSSGGGGFGVAPNLPNQPNLGGNISDPSNLGDLSDLNDLTNVDNLIANLPVFGESDGWTDGTMLLHGSCIDEVHITGQDARIVAAEWVTLPDLIDADGWQEVQHFYLPIAGDDVIYPNWDQSRSGEQIAADRLSAYPPRALPPWDEAHYPPSQASAQALEQDRQARYMGDGYTRLADKLHTMLRTELEEVVPQRAVTIDELLEPDAETKAQWEDADLREQIEGTSTASFSILEMVLASSLDPQMARLLGLMTTDNPPEADQPYDYAIHADYRRYQIAQHLDLEESKETLRAIRNRPPNDDGLRLPLDADFEEGEEALDYVRITSVATHIELRDHGAIDAPTGFTATSEPRVGQDPPVEVRMSWDAQTGTLYESMGRHVMYAVRRVYRGDDQALHASDPETGVKSPHVPANGRQMQLWDRTPPGLGDLKYKLSGMDIWGRFSDFAVTSIAVADTIAPPTPTGVAAELLGSPDTNNLWQALEITFDWTRGQRSLAPDLSHFVVHVEQGSVPYTFDQWNNVQFVPNQRQPLRIDWPSLSVTSPLSGVTVTPSSIPTDADEDVRLTVSIPDVVAPFDSRRRAQFSATIVAYDTHGNVSDPARRAVATRYDEEPPKTPSQPLTPQIASWPDADQQCYWRCEWSQPQPGVQTQVMRASQIRLLQAEGMSLDAFESQSTTERMNTLRQLAVKYPHVFAPDHGQSYEHGVTEHAVAVPAGERTWTVVTVQHISHTGVRAEWPQQPDNFAIVAAPDMRPPPRPVLNVQPAQEDGKIEISISSDPSGRTTRYLLYRTADRNAVGDVRRMQIVTRANSDSLEMTDKVTPDRWVAYRTLAVAQSGLQSNPTEPHWIRAGTSQPPTQPQITSIYCDANNGHCDIEARIEGYSLTLQLQRRMTGLGGWQPLTEQPLSSAHDVVDQGNGVCMVTLRDKLPQGTAPVGLYYRVVVIDRRGRRSTSQTESR